MAVPNASRYDPAMRNVLDFTNGGVTFGADPLRARLDLWQSVWKQRR
jgi:para-nitrobenzyl esterase